MNTKLAFLVIAMMAYGCVEAEVGVEDIPRCVKEFYEAFSGYDMPKSVDLYSRRVRAMLEDVDDDEDESKIKETLNTKDCQAHLDAFDERRAKVPCHEEFSESEHQFEFEENLYENELIADIILGAQLCEGQLKSGYKSKLLM